MPVPHQEYPWYEIRSPGLIPRQIVRAPNIQALLPTRPVDVHLSIHRYGEEALAYSRKEMPEIGKKVGSLKRFNGPSVSDGLWIDIDAEKTGREAVEESLDILRLMISYLEEKWGIPYGEYVTYFSGRRGFHIYLPFSLFKEGGFSPSPLFHVATHELFVLLLKDSDLLEEGPGGAWSGSGFDTGIYGPLHMIRMPHSIHPATGFWKNPLSKEALEDIDRIYKECSDPKTRYRPSARTASPAAESLGIILEERIRSSDFVYRGGRSVSHSLMDTGTIFSLAGLEDMDLPGYSPFLQRERRTLRALVGPIEEGKPFYEWAGRHQVMLHLCGYFSAKKISKEIATALLHTWNMSACIPPIEEEEFLGVINSLFPS